MGHIVQGKENETLLLGICGAQEQLHLGGRDHFQALRDLRGYKQEGLLVVRVHFSRQVLEEKGNDLVVEPMGTVQEVDVGLPEQRVVVGEHNCILFGTSHCSCRLEGQNSC